jgi:hypothetical protein
MNSISPSAPGRRAIMRACRGHQAVEELTGLPQSGLQPHRAALLRDFRR